MNLLEIRELRTSSSKVVEHRMEGLHGRLFHARSRKVGKRMQARGHKLTILNHPMKQLQDHILQSQEGAQAFGAARSHSLMACLEELRFGAFQC